MNTKTILSFIVATVITFLAISAVSALNVNIEDVKVNDVELGNGNGTAVLSGMPGETVPVVVRFESAEDLTDLKVRVWIEGYKNDVSASTARFDVVNGSTYKKTLQLTLPSVQDMEANPEGLTMYVRISNKNDYTESTYGISMERESYALNLISVEGPVTASAGEIIALDVVLKNIGGREAEDTFVTASIPELGVYKKAYFGDLTENDDSEADKQDARERRIYLVIPSDAKSGDYTLDVKASNYDTSATARKVISINGIAPTNNTATPIASNGSKMSTSIIVLTVVLVIVFVVLLVVLIVLLTKKPSERIEDFGETSYY